MLLIMRLADAEIQISTVLLFMVMSMFGLSVCAEDDFASQRRQMLSDIQDTYRRTSDYTGKPALDEKVMQVMSSVPRHEFIPANMQSYAYANRALPIGDGQTISQPYIVALMTELAGVDKQSVVLEVGTGSGYQAAVLAGLVQHVYSIEIVEKLGKRAAQTLKRLGYQNVTVRIGDGYHGWPKHAPFDAILVTAAPGKVPAPLLQQLKPGGRLVIPVGSQSGAQSLQLIEKDMSGKVLVHDVLPVGFVPLTRELR